MRPVTKPIPAVFETELLADHVQQLADDKVVAKFKHDGLNRILGGVRPGVNVAIGATPGAGKTTLILEEADKLAADGHAVIFTSGELPPHKLLAKSLSRLSENNLTLSEVADAAQPEHPKHGIFEKALSEYQRSIAPNLCITGPLNITDLGCVVGNVISERNQIPIVFADYLQLLSTVGIAEPYVDERLAISAYVKGLRNISNCYGVPIYVLSTITRSAYGNKKPNIGVFGGAAAIEYSFDAAIFLANDDKDDDFPFESWQGQPVTLTALKNRYGSLDTARLSFDGAHATFYDRK